MTPLSATLLATIPTLAKSSEGSENSENTETSEDSENSEDSEGSEDSESNEGSPLKVISWPLLGDLPTNVISNDGKRFQELLARIQKLEKLPG